MEEYWEDDEPTAISATGRPTVEMDAWQLAVANFDAELADGKDTFKRKTTIKTVQEEYSIYVMGALSAGSTSDTLGFWKVRCF